ncbi:MAG TPA: tetratricopeptide repeat protein [Pyrinomonadaceae bacterium]|jgi:tetratricopeptide (TPR) repeat protein
MSKIVRLPAMMLGGLLFSCSAVIAQAQQQQTAASSATTQTTAASSSAMSEAEALYQAQKFNEAARAFTLLTKAEPANGRAWLRLGGSLHALGQYEQAVTALQRAVEILRGPVAMYNLACAYARRGDKDKAFEWLTGALNAGFPQVALLQTDEDLAALRQDARFKETLSLGERLTKPCLYTAENRYFDFWVGEWDVQTGGQQAGTNSVQAILDGCVIFENWTSARGGTGKSFNFYNAATRKWQQTWVDSAGSVLELAGAYKDGKMQFTGETLRADGTKLLQRLTFFNLSADRVRQFWEQSTDNGKTWTVAFDGMYTRKKAAQP